ncbi:MAG: hypothetical protein H6R26_2075, partial [Proteobacteria bacterium]|nr:hypothetical protein [Pseudomonadota bacterium]
MTHFYAHPAVLVDAAGRSVKLQITAADIRHEIIGDPMSRSVL